MKTLDSQRTINVRGGFGKPPIPTEFKWAMTGAPLPNRPIELYPVLKWLEAPFARDEGQFGQRYCGGREREFRGATNIPELREKLQSIMLRRTKAEVLTDLPPKTRQVIELEIGDEGRIAINKEREVLKEAGMTFEQVIQRLDAGTLPPNKGIIAKLRKMVGLAKVPACAEHVIETVQGGVNKVIVFAHHREVIARIVAACLTAGIFAVAVNGRRNTQVEAAEC